MVGTVRSLVAGEAAFFAGGFGVEPVTISVELGFDEVVVKVKMVFFSPSGMF